MKNYLSILAWIVGCGFVLWLILFGSVWMVRSGCAGHLSLPYCNGGAFIDWLGDLVLLGWVKQYQSLIAGVFALGAGAFVLMSASITAQQAKAEQDARRRERLLAAFATAYGAFINAVHVFHTGSSRWQGSTFDVVKSVMGEIASADAILAGRLAQAAAATDIGLTDITAAREERAVSINEASLLARQGMAYSSAAAGFLFHIAERSVGRDGKYTHQRIPYGILIQSMTRTAFQPLAMPGMEYLYEGFPEG